VWRLYGKIRRVRRRPPIKRARVDVLRRPSRKRRRCVRRRPTCPCLSSRRVRHCPSISQLYRPRADVTRVAIVNVFVLYSVSLSFHLNSTGGNGQMALRSPLQALSEEALWSISLRRRRTTLDCRIYRLFNTFYYTFIRRLYTIIFVSRRLLENYSSIVYSPLLLLFFCG